MEASVDFLDFLDTDVVLNIFNCLDDPGDLARASAVSSIWRDFIIANGLSKQLCVQMFPQLLNIEHITEPACRTTQLTDAGSSKAMELEIKKKEHEVYVALLHVRTQLVSSPVDCILEAICASSTDNYPDESIINTLDPRDRFFRRASYWSSKGQKDPNVPETLIYKLRSDLCMITEINIQPFKAYFQPGDPIYSAKSVRFRMGHLKNQKDLSWASLQEPADDKFVWTYVSQEFTMTQENCLQHFKLPEPVLCIGGFLQIELSGRVQRQEMDDLFYICVSHVKVLGRPLSPAFDVEVLESRGKFLLKYSPDALPRTLEISSSSKDSESTNVRLVTSEDMLWNHVGLLQYLVGENQQDDDAAELDDDEYAADQFVV